MKKILFILACLTFMGAQAQTEIKYKDLDWITGNWKIDAGEVQIYESWKKAEGSSYVGEAWVIQGKDTLVTEVIRIEKVGPHWVYIAQINDDNPVLFTLKAGSTANDLIFENLEHDSPQRIVYRFVNKNEIYARTEAVAEGKEVVEEYPFTRR